MEEISTQLWRSKEIQELNMFHQVSENGLLGHTSLMATQVLHVKLIKPLIVFGNSFSQNIKKTHSLKRTFGLPTPQVIVLK